MPYRRRYISKQLHRASRIVVTCALEYEEKTYGQKGDRTVRYGKVF